MTSKETMQQEIKPGTIMIHNKTNHKYVYLYPAIDATNARDGTKVAVYRNNEGMIFIRDMHEFLQKFTVQK